MDVRRLTLGGRQRVQLVVQWPVAAHRGGVLRHAWHLDRLAVRVAKAFGELRGEPVGVDAEHRNHAAAEERLHDSRQVVGGRPRRGDRRSVRGRELGVLTKDRTVEASQRRPGVDPELVGERAARVLVGLQRLCLAPRPVESEHQLAA